MYNESSTNIVCQPCLIDNSIECDDNNENNPCLKWFPGYFVQEGVCIQCSSACSNICIGPNSSDCLGSYNDKSASVYYLTSDEFHLIIAQHAKKVIILIQVIVILVLKNINIAHLLIHA